MSAPKLTLAQFTIQAILNLRDVMNVKAVAKGFRPSKGIHVLFSGYTTALKAYFPGADPKAVTKQLQAEGVIDVVPAKMGAKIFLKGEAGGENDVDASKTLALILAAPKAAGPKRNVVRNAPPVRQQVQDGEEGTADLTQGQE